VENIIFILVLAGAIFILALVTFSTKKYVFLFSMSLINPSLYCAEKFSTYNAINLIYKNKAH